MLLQQLLQDRAHLLGRRIGGRQGHRRDVVRGLRILILEVVCGVGVPPLGLLRALPPHNAAVAIFVRYGHHTILPHLFHPLLPRALLLQFGLCRRLAPSVDRCFDNPNCFLGEGRIGAWG